MPCCSDYEHVSGQSERALLLLICAVAYHFLEGLFLLCEQISIPEILALCMSASLLVKYALHSGLVY